MPPSVTRVAPVALLVLAGFVAFGAVSVARQSSNVPADERTTDANITRLTTSILAQSQFAHHPLDSELAGRFLDRYLDALDNTRSLLLQTDVDELKPLRATLAETTRATGDTSAAFTIFARYVERLGQQVAFVTTTLKTASATFDFTGHETYSFDREKAPRPRDLAAAQALWLQQLRTEYLQEKLADKKPEQIVTTLTRRRERQLQMMKALQRDEILEMYLNALAHVYDPHSDYLGHEQLETLSISMNLSLFGIGAALETEDGNCKIRELLAGGPAARSGLLKPGDRILAVAQAGKEPVDIVNMPLSRSVELIRGPKGSTVTLTILPARAADGAGTKTVALVRDEIKLEDQEAKARILDLPTSATSATSPTTPGKTMRLGVIDLPSFYAEMGASRGGGHRSATVDVVRLLKKLQAEQVKGIVLDLRRNGGGSLDEAISLTGLFIRRGPVVQTRDAEGKVEVDSDRDDGVAYDGPLVLLTSRFSASASEILVGALQDYGRGVVVGDSSTFGKGTVQNVLPLASVMDRAGLAHSYDPGALKVTISKFYRPSGASTQLRGVVSDIILPSTTDFSDVSESALQDPLPWDTIPSATYEPVNRVQSALGQLRARSLARVKKEKEFAQLTSDIARLTKSMTSKTISLNEVERRQEMAQGKTRRAEREKESRTPRPGRPIVYEITLRNAATPGLPAPVPLAVAKAKAAKDAAKASPTDADDADDSTGSSTTPAADDVLLIEGAKILSDYVDLSKPTAH
jgi:carboxyl-terminal processing protease